MGSPPATLIETARLRLRPHRDDDRADLVALADNWQVARWLSALPHPYTDADAHSWIAHVQCPHAAGKPLCFAVALRSTDRLIGGAGLDGATGDGSPGPALGYWLGQPFWGQGFGREAVAAVIDYGFRVLGLAEIRAYTDPANAASQRVLMACGLQRVREIALVKPTREGSTRAPQFHIARPGPSHADLARSEARKPE